LCVVVNNVAAYTRFIPTSALWWSWGNS